MEENAVPLSRKISNSAVRRLSVYLRFLEEFEDEGILTVSSQELARRGATTAAQIRKDLSLFGSFGKRGLGYAVPPLARRLREILGLERSWRIALVGAGRIGSALSEYSGFRERGFEIAAIFDSDPAKVGTCLGGIRIRDMSEFEPEIRRKRFEIVVLAVPGEVAQEVADSAVAAGVRGILSFSAAHLRLPPGIALNEVNMALEMEALSFALHSRMADSEISAAGGEPADGGSGTEKPSGRSAGDEVAAGGEGERQPDPQADGAVSASRGRKS